MSKLTTEGTEGTEVATPDTDINCGYALTSHYGRSECRYLHMDRSGPFVPADFARKLERERDEARERSAKLAAQLLAEMEARP